MTDKELTPRCDKCGAEVSTGLMAAFCPKAEACEFWPDDESSQEFIKSLRQPRIILGYVEPAAAEIGRGM